MRKYSASMHSVRQVLLNQTLIAVLLGSILGREPSPPPLLPLVRIA